MTDTPPEPFAEFIIAHPTRTFKVSGSGFQLSRRWLWTSLSNEKPEFTTSIHGRVTGDEVCVFGMNKRSKAFDLTISSDQKSAESWKRAKEADLLLDVVTDPERRRIRAIQHERFDNIPPTATLFNQRSYWSLECEIALPVLEQFSADLVAQSVDTVKMSVEWPFASTETKSGSWGFYDGGQLRGYVCNLTWFTPPGFVTPRGSAGPTKEK
jgi:hypothetical protein